MHSQVEPWRSCNVLSFGRSGEPVRAETGEEIRRGGKGEAEFFVSLLKLRTTHILWGELGYAEHAQSAGLEICQCFFGYIIFHSHSLSDHDTSSVNLKTNIQAIRMSLPRHYKQLLMACTRNENTH